jgi:transcriptional regulator with PAS, ATPase and Fis domain
VATATATATAPKTKAASVPALADLALGDAQMRSVVDKVRRVMDRDVPLLILGGTGTGKEYLAKAIHHASLRKNHAFVAVNCASVPENLIESELFGYEEGAFTGAKRKGAVGKLLQADGGTLLLDEIGDMPLAMQARLLRVLQERKVVPLGGSKSHDIDVNLVCATHRNLREMIAEGSFREDLYYRINGLAVRLPRLSERTDLRTLCQQMLTQLSPHHALTLGESLADDFAQYDWPGNLRELHNVLRTATVLAGSDRQITRVHLSDDFLADLAIARARAPASAAAVLVGSSQARFEAQQLDEIRDAVKAQHGNVTLAAKALNVSRNTIYRKLKAAGISL